MALCRCYTTHNLIVLINFYAVAMPEPAGQRLVLEAVCWLIMI